jgi:hypothetical protein
MAAEDKKNGYSIPNGYFDNLSENIRISIFLSEIEHKKSDNGFITPRNYFNELESKLSKIPRNFTNSAPKKTLKIISLNFIKYAVAATFLLISAFAFYTYTNSNNNLQNKLGSLSNEDIEVYLQNTTNASDVPLLIENVDDIKIDVSKNIDTQSVKNYLSETI